MDREKLIAYIKNSPILDNWHWYRYHFQCLQDDYEHPFVKSIIDTLLCVENKIPGYAFNTIDKIASLNGKEKYLPHYDQLKQVLAEVFVVSQLVKELGDGDFKDEPTIGSSKKNPELTIMFNNYTLGVEAKSPALREHGENRSARDVQLPGRISIADSVFSMEGKDNVTLPRDNPVKDFLISSNEKFVEFKKKITNFYGVLVIVWDDFVYEPITSLISDHSGLFTENSFALDEKNHPLRFRNVDAVILIRQLHQFVEAAAERPLIDGKAHAFDYGKKGEFPFKIVIPNPEGKKLPDEIISAFQAVDLDERLGAEYRPQEYIMWINQKKNSS